MLQAGGKQQLDEKASWALGQQLASG